LTVSQRGDLNAGKTAISGTPTREEDFTLDMTGNWPTYVQKTSGSTTLNQSRGHNVANEVTSASSWATPAHDRAGNMTTVPKPSSLANGLTLKYDAWNRLVEVKDGATVVAKYEYDATGRRVKRHIDSQSPSGPNGVDRYEHLFYNGLQVIETRGTTNVNDAAQNLQPKYQYVWSLRYIDAPVLRDQNTDNDGLCDDARIYFLGDANMNVTSLVDTAGDALERYVYDPYGRVTMYDAAWSSTRSTSTYSNTALYTGRELDPESLFYFYRARYYGTELGRFRSRDPIAYRGGRNLYAYVDDSPVMHADPTGLRPATQPTVSDIAYCLAKLEWGATVGPAFGYSCASELLWLFLGHRKRSSYWECPEVCKEKLAADSFVDLPSAAELNKRSQCGKSGTASGGSMKGHHEFKVGDLFYSFHGADWSVWAHGNYTCSASQVYTVDGKQSCCCECSADLCIHGNLQDKYDFCRGLSEKEPVHSWAWCGCAIETAQSLLSVAGDIIGRPFDIRCNWIRSAKRSFTHCE
jgi:RHS repeat-associated protein